MKKTKRILAMICAVLLFGMYACTLIFALTDQSGTMDLLKASIACTLVLPVLLYAYTLVYRILHRNEKPTNHDHSDTDR